jgi:putative ABC transport system substrate-binding protein
MRVGALALAIVLFGSLDPADAQPAGKVPKVGYLRLANEPAESRRHEGFARGLRDLGYVPGQSIVVDVRDYTTNDQLRQALNDFVRLKVDVIFVGPPVVAMAAKQATGAIPIVCGTCGDPVENGLAASLSRPGGNVTGLASLSADLIGKRVELMKELFPSVSRLAVFVYPANPGTRATLSALDAAGRTLRIELQRVEIRGAGDFENAFRAVATGGAGGVVLQDDPLTRSARAQIVQLALKHRLPVSTGLLEVAESGALIAYGPDRVDLYRRAAGLVDRILKGAKPADLPFEQATKFELVLNLTTAKALGVTIPQSFLLRADRVIE